MAELSIRSSTEVGTSPAADARPALNLMAWSPSRSLEHPEWVAAGRRLGAIGRSNQWWMGDWLRYGAAKWGEKYVEASRITGYDVGSLRNMASLATQFSLSRRRDNLTWCHHAAVASLEASEQDYWLDRAIALKLSVADLRVELRTARRLRERTVERDNGLPQGAAGIAADTVTTTVVNAAVAPGHTSVEGELVCPNCGHRVPLSARTEVLSTS
jgi:hypothetical protein